MLHIWNWLNFWKRLWYLIAKSCHSKTVSTVLYEFVQKTNFNSLGSTDERDLVATLITWGNLWRTDAFISRSFSHMSCCLYLQMSKIFPQNIWQWTRRNTDDTLGDHKILKGSMDSISLPSPSVKIQIKYWWESLLQV